MKLKTILISIILAIHSIAVTAGDKNGAGGNELVAALIQVSKKVPGILYHPDNLSVFKDEQRLMIRNRIMAGLPMNLLKAEDIVKNAYLFPRASEPVRKFISPNGDKFTQMVVKNWDSSGKFVILWDELYWKEKLLKLISNELSQGLQQSLFREILHETLRLLYFEKPPWIENDDGYSISLKIDFSKSLETLPQLPNVDFFRAEIPLEFHSSFYSYNVKIQEELDAIADLGREEAKKLHGAFLADTKASTLKYLGNHFAPTSIIPSENITYSRPLFKTSFGHYKDHGVKFSVSTDFLGAILKNTLWQYQIKQFTFLDFNDLPFDKVSSLDLPNINGSRYWWTAIKGTSFDVVQKQFTKAKLDLIDRQEKFEMQIKRELGDRYVVFHSGVISHNYQIDFEVADKDLTLGSTFRSVSFGSSGGKIYYLRNNPISADAIKKIAEQFAKIEDRDIPEEAKPTPKEECFCYSTTLLGSGVAGCAIGPTVRLGIGGACTQTACEELNKLERAKKSCDGVIRIQN